MANDTTTPADGGNDAPDAPDTGSAWTPPASQAEMNRIIADRVERTKRQFAGYAELKEKAARFDELQDAAKSETDRLRERIAETERHAAEVENRALRHEVAAAKGVPADMVTGTTREEMTESADRLLAWRNDAAESGTLNPRGGFFSGASARESNTDPKERAAAALRELGRRRAL